MIRFIQSLNADEAARVLKSLLDEDPLLTKKIYDIAVKVAGNVDAESIRIRVFSALDRLDMDDLNSRAGRTRYGYVEPDEAAWELFEEALNPFKRIISCSALVLAFFLKNPQTRFEV